MLRDSHRKWLGQAFQLIIDYLLFELRFFTTFRMTIIWTDPSTSSGWQRQNSEFRIANLECRIHLIRTVHETSGYFLLERGVFAGFLWFLWWIFGRGIISFKKGLIWFYESDIVQQLENCSVARGSFGIDYLLLNIDYWKAANSQFVKKRK